MTASECDQPQETTLFYTLKLTKNNLLYCRHWILHDYIFRALKQNVSIPSYAKKVEKKKKVFYTLYALTVHCECQMCVDGKCVLTLFVFTLHA